MGGFGLTVGTSGVGTGWIGVGSGVIGGVGTVGICGVVVIVGPTFVVGPVHGAEGMAGGNPTAAMVSVSNPVPSWATTPTF